MLYQGKKVEVIGTKTVLGNDIAWIHVFEDNSFQQVLASDLEEERHDSVSLAKIRYVAIAARIKEEIAEKHVLAPYESSLIPLPHQMLVLEKVMAARETRFLLADEVGMGKTIEAGLIIKEKKLRGEIRRILLIVPKSAMLQWQSELKEHFNEQFAIYDSQYIGTMARTFANFNAEEELNFWRQHNQIIVPTDALRPIEFHRGWTKEQVDEWNKYRLQAVIDADFDMLIIDEAHRMGGATAQVSRYQLADALCNVVPSVLLLSATPHRGKSDHFRRVLQLIDCDAFQGLGLPSIKELEPYVIRSEKRNAVDYDGHDLFQKRTTYPELVELDNYEDKLQLKLYADVSDYVIRCFLGPAQKLVLIMMQKMASSSTAAIFSALRTRLANVQEEKDGSLEDYDEEARFATEEAIIDIHGYDVEVDADELDILPGLITQAQECLNTETDAKLRRLLVMISNIRSTDEEDDTKILVFTEFRHTQEYIISYLEKNGLKCARVNGSMDLIKRHLELQSFKDECQVMVATDAAGESLNMQFCHVVINYDLPWNPMQLEQRIGRVDRIGQKYEVKAYNMMTNNSVDYRVYEIITKKLDMILDQLGIDKTSDVLDSTIEQDDINILYLQSLLDPSRLEQEGNDWLAKIKNKLRDYQSTEGLLPSVPKEEIDHKSASDVKYSPLPVWLEQLMDLYTVSIQGNVQKQLNGSTRYMLPGVTIDAVFDSEKAAEIPTAESLTLQTPLVKKIIDEIDSDVINEIPVLKSADEDVTPGYFSIWKVEARNELQCKEQYIPIYLTDNGKVFDTYANKLWSDFVHGRRGFSVIKSLPKDSLKDNEAVYSRLLSTFGTLANDIRNTLTEKRQNKMHALDYAEQRLEHIGIENIRNAKQKRINIERKAWMAQMKQKSSIVPQLTQILTIRIDG